MKTLKLVVVALLFSGAVCPAGARAGEAEPEREKVRMVDDQESREPSPPIAELDGVRPKRNVWQGSSWKKPLVLKSEKEAAEHFGADELVKLTKQVDFGKQFVLLFTWRGSGQDRLEVAVAESYPEQIYFTYRPGRTRDLVQHVRAYALRSNVSWHVRE